MTTGYATSADGLEWEWHGTVLAGRAGEWDARGARLTAVLPDGRAAYDGRATKEQNWFEQIGIAEPKSTAASPRPGRPSSTLGTWKSCRSRTADYRLFYEARLPDESHELRTETVPPT